MKQKLMKETGRFITGLMLCLIIAGTKAHASEGEEFITISVEAQDNSNGQMMYALDTDDPSAFTTSNSFTVPAGTPHTIYVKDAAGNITSQSFEGKPAGEAVTPAVTNDGMENSTPNDQQIDINLELEPSQSSTNTEKGSYDYMTDIPVEKGNGTLQSKVKTDGSSDASRLFYTITTDDGDVFYMVIDQNQTADNVYLLEQVKTTDLQALASDGETVEEEKSLLDALAAKEETEKEAPEPEIAEPKSEKKINGNIIILFLLLIAGGGYYYYMKIYKVKKEQEIDALDAMDMDEFAAEEEEKEEVEFDIDDEEQDEYIQHLIDKEEEILLDADPDDYYPAEQGEAVYEEEEQETEALYEDDTIDELDVEEENEE